MQGSFNGKPKATFPLSFDETVAFGLPLNETVAFGLPLNETVAFGLPLNELMRPPLIAEQARTFALR